MSWFDLHERDVAPFVIDYHDVTLSFEFGFTSTRQPGVWLSISGHDYRLESAAAEYRTIYDAWLRQDELIMRIGRMLFDTPNLMVTKMVQDLKILPSELAAVANTLCQILPDSLTSMRQALEQVSRLAREQPSAGARTDDPPQIREVFSGKFVFREHFYMMAGYAPEPLALCIHLPGSFTIELHVGEEHVPLGLNMYFYDLDFTTGGRGSVNTDGLGGGTDWGPMRQLLSHLKSSGKVGVTDSSDGAYRLFVIPPQSALGRDIMDGKRGQRPVLATGESVSRRPGPSTRDPLLVGVLQMFVDDPDPSTYHARTVDPLSAVGETNKKPVVSFSLARNASTKRGKKTGINQANMSESGAKCFARGGPKRLRGRTEGLNSPSSSSTSKRTGKVDVPSRDIHVSGGGGDRRNKGSEGGDISKEQPKKQEDKHSKPKTTKKPAAVEEYDPFAAAEEAETAEEYDPFVAAKRAESRTSSKAAGTTAGGTSKQTTRRSSTTADRGSDNDMDWEPLP